MPPKAWEELKSFMKNLIGNTADTGGSATAGTPVAKLNHIINKLADDGVVAKSVRSVQSGRIPVGTALTGAELFKSVGNNYMYTSYLDITIAPVLDANKCSVQIKQFGASSNYLYSGLMINDKTLRIYVVPAGSAEAYSSQATSAACTWEVVEYY